MSALYQSYLDTSTTADISLVGYFPDNDYEQQNMDAYRRASLMDKGPEEIAMPSDDLGRDARAYMSREALRIRYDPREEVRRGEIDLNDYSQDFKPGEDRNAIMIEAINDDRRRIYGTAYFKRDSAHQVPIGRVAPTTENDMTYAAQFGATRLRQDFYMEREDRVPGSTILHGIPKSKLSYNPNACLVAEKAMKGYAQEIRATTGMMYHGKVKVMDKIFNGLKGATFEDAVCTIHRAKKMGASRGQRVTGKGDAEFGDVTSDKVRSTFSHLRQKASNQRLGKISEDSFGDSGTMIVAARAIAKRPNRGLGKNEADFDDASLENVRKIYAKIDKMNKITAANGEMDFEEAVESALTRAARETRKLSSFYYAAHRVEGDFEDSMTGTPKASLKKTSKGVERRANLEDDEMGSEDEGIVSKRVHKMSKTVPRDMHGDGTFDDSTNDMMGRRYIAPVRVDRRNVKYAVDKGADSAEGRMVSRGRMSTGPIHDMNEENTMMRG